MPTASEATAKFKEFLKSLKEVQSPLQEQNSAYKSEISKFNAATDARLSTILSALDEAQIGKLETALSSASADWSAPEFIASLSEESRDNAVKAAQIEGVHGNADTIYKRLSDLHEQAQPHLLQHSSLGILGRKLGPVKDPTKTADLLERVLQNMQHDLEYGHGSIAGIRAYNEYAAGNNLDTITSENFDAFKKSVLWHAWNTLSREREINAQAAASKCIRSRSAHFVARDLELFDKAVANFAAFQDLKGKINEQQEVYAELKGHEDKILEQSDIEALLREKIKQTLVSNKVFRTAFAAEFGADGQEIIASHSKSVLLGQLQKNIAKQERGVGKAISDIEEGLRKLDRVSSYRTVRTDLDKIEKSIKDGVYDIEHYIGQMDDRRQRVSHYAPDRSSTNTHDDGLYFNYMMLYIILSSSTIDNAATPQEMGADLSAIFGDTMPDLAALDIDKFDLNTNTIAIPGIDIGGSVDISSSLSDISSSMPSPSDYGGGYSGGGYDGGGASFGGGDGGGF